MAADATAARAVGVPYRVTSRRKMRERAFWLFITPWILGFIFLTTLPLLLGLATSMTNFDGMNLPTLKFVGLNNYARVFDDEDAIYSIGRTIVFVTTAVPLMLVTSMALAVGLNQDVKGRGVFRTILYIPYIIPVVAGTFAWKLIADRNVGFFNAVIDLFHPGFAINWLGEQSTLILVAYCTWAAAGSGMIIFLAGLQGIPSELREAAQIDGANGWRVFRNVTLPLMTPVIFFQLIMSLIGALQTFVQAVLLAPVQSGGAAMQTLPPRPNQLFMVYDYMQIFVRNRYGYGVALLWVLFLMVLVLTVIVFYSERYWVYYEVESGKR
jgi:multiple sugar transport system permease protein